MSYLYHITAVTTFLSAFLLFQVQPLIGKHILPWFGGGSMIWITALCFFMSVLLLGYLYVLLLSQLSFKKQKLAHTGVVLMVVAFVLSNSLHWSSAITPDLSNMSVLSIPAWSILLVLLKSVGAPFFLLSTTSALLQLWYGHSSGREPFSLYAISNCGSLLGLVSYPFIFEPLLSTSQQGLLWSVIFFLYLVGLGLTAWFSTSKETSTKETSPSSKNPVTALMFSKWTFVASVPVAAMLASTNFISGFVASVPFIWVVPLALYLSSFIITFRPGVKPNLAFSALLAALLTLGAIAVTSMANLSALPVILGVLWSAFFAIAHYCHEWLYVNRPEPAALPWFYVALSLGGFLGSVAILLVTLVFLKTPIEFLLILVGVQAVTLWHLYEKQHEPDSQIAGWRLHTLALFAGLMVSTLVLSKNAYLQNTIQQERNFYGAKTVTERTDEDGKVLRVLIHEATTHGYQYQNAEDIQKPTSYYVESSGLGKAFAHLQANNGSIHVGAIGLGVGTVSAYCRAGDEFTFFEIDRQVIALAQNNFSYLALCPRVDIQEGDARQLFLRDREKNAGLYNLIIVDAYADDAVPTHLLTEEAFALYEGELAEGGIIAFHISSRYLDLVPVMQGLVERSGFWGREYTDATNNPLGTQSIWVLMTKEEQVFFDPVFSDMTTFTEIEPVFWTDTKNAILPVVRFGN